MKIGFFFLCKPNMMRSQVFSEQDVSRDIVGCLWVVVDQSLSLKGYIRYSPSDKIRNRLISIH